MSPFERRQIVDEIVRVGFTCLGEGGAAAIEGIDEKEGHVIAVGPSGVRLVDAGEAIPEAVGQARTEHRIVADRHPVVVEESLALRGLPRKGWWIVDRVVLLTKTPKQLVVA